MTRVLGWATRSAGGRAGALRCPIRAMALWPIRRPGWCRTCRAGRAVSDVTQAVGQGAVRLRVVGGEFAVLSAHKLGGPKGVGALIVRRGIDAAALSRGGGQEMGRRSGTENVIGIAGFGAATGRRCAISRTGVWDEVAQLRNILETTLAAARRDYFCRERRGAPAQHHLHRRARLEGRDAGDADGPRGLRGFGRVGLFEREGAGEPGAARDGV